MKINTEQTDALLRQQERATAKPGTGAANAFEALLAERLGSRVEGGPSAASPLPPGAERAGMISEMLLTGSEKSDATGVDEEVFQEALNVASGTLDLWDSYVGALKTPGNSLRDAYALLEGIDSKVAGLKGKTVDVRGQSQVIDSLVNELEIMAATEKFKFNRGDYSV
jgi:hypothetical protein